MEAIIETPRFGFVKRKADGSVDFISPLPCPFNYGHVEGITSGDGDPLDAIVMGPRLAAGTRCAAEQRGTVFFVDDGEEDPKIVLSDRELGSFDRLQIRAFFETYVLFKRALNFARGRRGRTFVRSYEGI